MPSKSPAQHRLMEAAAHTKGGFGGVPQAVGREFAHADSLRKRVSSKKLGAKESSPLPHGFGR